MSNTLPNIVPTVDDTEAVLYYKVSEVDSKMYKEKYEKQLESGEIDLETKFQYAWCLVHSQHRSDIKKASILLKDLFTEGTEEIKRDSLFYLAIAETKQKNYCTAKTYIKAFLSVEPNNIQAEQLKTYIEEHLKKDGIKGMALFGAAAVFGGATAVVLGTLAIGAAISFALGKTKK